MFPAQTVRAAPPWIGSRIADVRDQQQWVRMRRWPRIPKFSTEWPVPGGKSGIWRRKSGSSPSLSLLPKVAVLAGRSMFMIRCFDDYRKSPTTKAPITTNRNSPISARSLKVVDRKPLTIDCRLQAERINFFSVNSVRRYLAFGSGIG